MPLAAVVLCAGGDGPKPSGDALVAFQSLLEMLQLRSRAPWRCFSCVPELLGDASVEFQSSLEMLQLSSRAPWRYSSCLPELPGDAAVAYEDSVATCLTPG